MSRDNGFCGVDDVGELEGGGASVPGGWEAFGAEERVECSAGGVVRDAWCGLCRFIRQLVDGACDGWYVTYRQRRG